MSLPTPLAPRTLRAVRADAFADPLFLLRVARMTARFSRFTLAPAVLAQMQASVAVGCLDRLSPVQFWQFFAAGLMHAQPSRMLMTLREGHALRHLLPEVDALFGIPQSADDPPSVDVGRHQMRLLDLAAAADAPLAVRFAGLMHKLGKAGSPREFWPSHYNHESRGATTLAALCARLPVPADCRELALLIINEADRVHKAVDMRAAALASLLERIHAVQQPERFQQLLQVCTCDYRAYPWRDTQPYAKAERLQRAYEAFVSVDVSRLAPGEILPARAAAISNALGSLRNA